MVAHFPREQKVGDLPVRRGGFQENAGARTGTYAYCADGDISHVFCVCSAAPALGVGRLRNSDGDPAWRGESGSVRYMLEEDVEGLCRVEGYEAAHAWCV